MQATAVVQAESPIESVWRALATVDDPELGVNGVDLGLVYSVNVDGELARVEMTMTSPTCPLGPFIAEQAKEAVSAALPELRRVEVELVWDPPWEPSRMADHVRAELDPSR
jgi:metal-sulfur cluster biosynthetic enzyme